MNLLGTVDRLVKADLSEIVYQVQRHMDVTAEEVVADLKVLEDKGLVSVEILVSLTGEGKAAL